MKPQERARRHAKWQLLIHEHEKSGCTQRLFCKQRGISAAQLSYYRSILKTSKPAPQADTALLAPIKIQPPVRISAPQPYSPDEIKVTLPNGFKCAVPINTPPASFKGFLQVLLSC